MKIKDFQIVKKKEGFSLQAIVPPNYGYQEICCGYSFCRERGSNILAFESSRGYSLFAIERGELIAGPTDVFDYKSNQQVFVYQKEKNGSWFERSFQHNEEICLGECPDNFFVLESRTEEVLNIFMYDERGDRRRFECQDWDRMEKYNVFLLKNGLYKIYSQDTKIPYELQKGTFLIRDLLDDTEYRFIRQEKQKAYKRL